MDEPSRKTSLDTLVSQLSKPSSPEVPDSPPMGSVPPPSRLPISAPLPVLPVKPPSVPPPAAGPTPTSGMTPPSRPPAPTFPQPSRPFVSQYPSPATSQPDQPTEYKTSLRTMAGDVSKIKIGQVPSGLDISKTIAEQKPAIAPVPIIKSAPIQSPAQPSRLGEVSQVRPPTPGTPTAPTTAPVTPRQAPSPQIAIPPDIPRRSSSLLFTLIALGALVVGATYWFFSSRTQEPEIVLSPTPSKSEEPTPTPLKNLRSYFGADTASIELTNAPNPGAEFANQLASVQLNGGQVKKLSITSAAKGSAEYTPTNLLDRFLIAYPPQLVDSLGDDTAVLAYGQREIFDTNGNLLTDSPVQNRVILVSEIRDAATATVTNTMREWEATMTDGLAGLFGYNKARSTPKTFADNLYQGTGLRFKNFPWPDKSIDYGLVNASNGKTYLLISNSRESAFVGIDRLLGR